MPTDNNNVLQQAVVLVTEGGLPAEGIGIQLTPQFVLGTGGHDHLNPPPLNLLGSIAFAGGDSLTGPNGQAGFTYTAPEFSGQLQLTASATSGGVTAVDRDTVLVRVPGLIKFAGEGDYILTGGDSNLHSNQSTHFLISQQAVGSLINVADAFSVAPWNFTGIMRLNDMSLAWGGLFDFKGDWKKPHASHRFGTDVDIENISTRDTTVVVVNPKTGQPRERTVLVFDQIWFIRYRELMLDANWSFIDEGQTSPNRQPSNDEPGIRFPHFRWRGN